MQVRYDTQHRCFSFPFQPAVARLQQTHITAKTINNKTFYTLLLRLGQQLQSTVQVGKDTALINIRHHQHRAVYCLSKAHIGNIIFPQIYFRRTAGPFCNN